LTELELLSLPGAHFLSNHPTKPNPPPAASSNKVRASHLLIKHKDSRRASSWKQSVITRTKSEAIEILKQHQLYLNDSPDLATAFAELAQRESDCSSARDGGDLGKLSLHRSSTEFTSLPSSPSLNIVHPSSAE
jgi:NIMA-interacting peptidyl-prolyl cis-trans isomerase 1